MTAAAFALMFAAVMAASARAQEAGSRDDSSWEKVDSVLVVPPVYRPGAATDADSLPTDGCAEDCPTTDNPGAGESPTAVMGTADDSTTAGAGTADDPTDQSVAVDGSTAAGPGAQQQAAAAGDQQSADGPDSSVGSAKDYQERQAAQDLGSNGLVQLPVVIIAAPAGSYYAPRSFAPAAPISAPARSLSSPAWMPPPMPRVAPLPSLVPHGVGGNVGGFPGGFPGGVSGGFRGGFSQMPRFGGGFDFGHR